MHINMVSFGVKLRPRKQGMQDGACMPAQSSLFGLMTPAVSEVAGKDVT
jgi:hypothetical protein